MAEVLVIDDDPRVSSAIANLVERMGHGTTSCMTLQEGLDTARSHPFDVVFLDVKMPDGNGLDVLPLIRETPSSPEVIIITGFGDPDAAETAVRSGAWDYIQKPSSMQAMTLPLVRALEYREAKKAAPARMSVRREGIVGSSPQITACLELVAQAASSDASVLITGETGTGKELFAWAIHKNSRRTDGNFVVVDCAALPETLVESTLFGYEKGAYTGADRSQIGLMTQANGGTLFLDEVGELPLTAQNSFLRALEERRYRPVGGRQEISSNFRIIAATNRDLQALVQQGRFRQDLLFRLRALTLDVPPLREHVQDIKELTTYYVTHRCEDYGIDDKGFSPDFFHTLAQYHWPGNVRELIHALEQALAAAPHEPVLYPKHLPTGIRARLARDSVERTEGTGPQAGAPSRRLPPLQRIREVAVSDAERDYLRELLSLTEGDVPEACLISGLSRSRLYALLKKYGLSPTRRS
jgi:two-component system NtrC family response regulator